MQDICMSIMEDPAPRIVLMLGVQKAHTRLIAPLRGIMSSTSMAMIMEQRRNLQRAVTETGL